MAKKIEFIPVTDPHSLREKLEEMVNSDWEIKGFVSFNSGNPCGDSYAVLERYTEKEPLLEQQYEMENPLQEKSVRAPSAKKQISISIGGN